VDIAAEAGWINSEFDSFIQKGTVGSAVLTETGDISEFCFSISLKTPTQNSVS
jgi:hypothetical protein